MPTQSIDTTIIRSGATMLRSADNKLNSSFSELQRKFRRLERVWKGQAGSRAQTKFYELAKHNTDRSSVVQNYITMLEQVVAPGYESAEKANRTLADNFK